MRDRWFEEMVEAPIPRSLINEPIDFEVDFVVRETATARALRRWHMPEDEIEELKDGKTCETRSELKRDGA